MNAARLLDISEAAEMLHCSVAKVRQMVIGDRTLAAVHEDYQGFRTSFQLGGLRLFDVDVLGVISVRGRGREHAGFLRFDLAEVFRVLSKQAHWEANAVPLSELFPPALGESESSALACGGQTQTTPKAVPTPVLVIDAALKKVALVASFLWEWPSIVNDIQDASRNGLKAAAHTEKHGMWRSDKARAWAVSKGKIKQSAPVQSLAGAWPGATTRHKNTG